MRRAACIESIEHLKNDIWQKFRDRIEKFPLPRSAKAVRAPMCLIFARLPQDAADIKYSLDYWNAASGSSIDIFFPGWSTDRHWQPELYAKFERELKQASKWKPSSLASALILDYTIDLADKSIQVDLSTCITVPVGLLIKRGDLYALDQFVTELIYMAQTLQDEDSDSRSWTLSDKFFIQNGFPAAIKWASSKDKLAGLFDFFAGLKDYTADDLRRVK